MAKPNPYAISQLRRMFGNGTFWAQRVPNVGQRTTGVVGCWYVFWVYVNTDNAAVHVQDVTLTIAHALGYRLSQKHYWLIGRNFSLDGSDIREDIRTLLDMPDFEWKVIQ